ncbi:unnamed protein product [Callosobruchus maculatus]|uniref:Uncharacterized protein n=1 Tax=Callosobruchus maculatus TaxID=64391 RepID=A0A653CN82_CALMS|nr:unnamed protein product [Callosobruchus maculatus]
MPRKILRRRTKDNRNRTTKTAGWIMLVRYSENLPRVRLRAAGEEAAVRSYPRSR